MFLKVSYPQKVIFPCAAYMYSVYIPSTVVLQSISPLFNMTENHDFQNNYALLSTTKLSQMTEMMNHELYLIWKLFGFSQTFPF